MSLLSIVASSSAFLLPSSPPPKGSSIDSDWSIKNKKQPGFLRLISAWYAMVSLQFSHDDSASLPGLDPESRAPVRSFGIAAGPAIWLFPTPAFLWPLALEAALPGALWGGHGLAAMDLTVDLSPAQAPLFTSPSSHDSLAPPLRVCDSPERKE